MTDDELDSVQRLWRPDATLGRIVLHERLQILRKLRLSVVNRCDLRCFFCHNEGQGLLGESAASPSVQQLVATCRAAVAEGTTEVKLTGGEPLLYRHDGDGIVELVRRLSALRGHEHFGLSMTTNGTGLRRLAGPLAEAGLDRVTVSLHTLSPQTLRSSFGVKSGNYLERVVAGIKEARAVGMGPVKINTVLFGPSGSDRGNLAELSSIVRLAQETGVSELRVYTMLENSNYQGQDFRSRSVDQVSAAECVANALSGSPSRRTVLRDTILEFRRAWAHVLYPKPTLQLFAGDLVVSLEAMEPERFAEVGLSAEGPYALRVAANGAIRATLDGPVVSSVPSRSGALGDGSTTRVAIRSARRSMPADASAGRLARPDSKDAPTVAMDSR